MKRIAITLMVLATLGTAGLAVGSGRTAAPSCGSLSLGPGALKRSVGPGASCLLRAYKQHCRRAGYRLSIFGVDTVGVRTFTTVRRDNRCEVAITSSFRVIPQPPHAATRGYCRTLRQQTNNIFASGCSGGGLPGRVSLTSTS